MAGAELSLPPILCYHKVDTRFELGFTQLEPQAFRRQVEALAKLGYRSLGSAALAARVGVGEGQDAPDDGAPTVVFTFDDAYAALAVHALPVLADHGFTALLFVITDYAGRENTWDVQYGWRRFTHLDWDALGAWQTRGFEAQSHGATHARLPWLSDGEVAEELQRSREAIHARLGTWPSAVSYPFGSVDARVRRLAAAAGYTLGFGGPSERGADPLALPRRPVYGWDTFAPPLALGRSALSPVALSLARFTNSCAVGTAWIQKTLGRRYKRGVRGQGPGVRA